MLKPVLFLVTAFVLGALHALEPGHGKALIAAYLAGKQGNGLQLLWLALIVTVTHVVSVAALTLLGLLLAHQVYPSEQTQWLLWLYRFSSLMIVGIGVTMVWRLWRAAAVDQTDETCCVGGLHHHHPPEPAWADTPTTPLAKAVRTTQTLTHSSSKTTPWGELVALGVASGISPCPVALAALMLALAYSGWQAWPKALLVLLVFSLGLGGMLALVGGVTLWGRRWLAGQSHFTQLLAFLPRVAAVLLLTVGLVLTARSFWLPPEQLLHTSEKELERWGQLLPLHSGKPSSGNPATVH